MSTPDTASHGAPTIRKLTRSDLKASLALGVRDFYSAAFIDLCLASFFVGAGLLMTLITYWTGQTFWLVLAVLGFPMVGTLCALGFYEISRQRMLDKTPNFPSIARLIWASRGGQVPWFATIIVVIFLFWFFLGHMIFALFLGLSPMTNVSTSFHVFFTMQGAMMIIVGTAVGAGFSGLVFAVSVHGVPMLLDCDVDFITAMLRSMSTVFESLPLYLGWGAFIGFVTLVSVAPLFFGLFVTMPVLGHASWHLYNRLTEARMECS